MTVTESIKVNLPDLQATAELAIYLSKLLRPGLVIYLHGDLGMGKTTLVRSLLQVLHYSGVIKSPTYTLVETYSLSGLTVHHFDLYRLADPEELDFIGIRDYSSADNVLIFEWPERGLGHIPVADLQIDMEFSNNMRVATIVAKSALGAELLQANKF